jgi:triosephosphate isomerase (TIM)
MRKTLVAGNWKMNGSTESISALLQGLLSEPKNEQVEWAVFPPFVYLPMVSETLRASPISFGGQSLSAASKGAYTGQISAEMLLDFGCKYVLVGHSERRVFFQGGNELMAQKFQAALSVGLKPILCLGETLEQREAGRTIHIIKEQLEVVLALQDNPSMMAQAVIAYEPIWAIGTGLNASPEQAQEVHQAIRSRVAEFDPQLASQIRILYGGSVKPSNSAALLAMPDIDGALVGGASLDAKQFLAIGEACNNF